MRAFGNPIGNPVRGPDGGQGTKIGDIVFAAKAPSSNFIPITNQRVYADQYPRLADVLQVRRENDGGDWLRPGGIFPNADPSGGRTFEPVFGGTSAGQNVLVMYNTYAESGGNEPHVVARGSTASKSFSTFEALPSPISGGGRILGGAVSENGTIVMVHLTLAIQGEYYSQIVRSTDALRTATSTPVEQAGLGSAKRFIAQRAPVISMGGNTWIIINYYGDVFRSDDDGRNWRLVNKITWTGISSGNNYNVERYVLDAIAVGGRIWVANGAQTRGANTDLQEDVLAYSDDLFASYGRLRLTNTNMYYSISRSLGVIGQDIVLIQTQRTDREVAVSQANVPVRGLYIPEANPSNPPTFFEMTGTEGGGNGFEVAVFSWDGIGYMGIPSYGFFRVQPRSLAKTLLASTRRDSANGQWDKRSFLKFANFVLVWSYQTLTLPQWSAEFLQAVPSDLARRYYQFSDAAVVGAQRSDGRLPFMRAR